MIGQSSKKAFTLVEMMIGIILVGLVSSTSWMGVSVLMKSASTAENRSVAVNLLQKSQEEVRRAAGTFFDQLEVCQFPADVASAGENRCGFSATAATFPGFSRNLAVTAQEGNADLKRGLITVSWKEFGQDRQLQSVVLLSRPPTPLPGNIIGLVHTLATAGGPVANATISVTQVGGSLSRATLSTGTMDGRGANFNLGEQSTGKFLLPAGSWRLTVSRSGFFPYTHPGLIVVNSNEEVFVDVGLEPLPETAYLTARLINGTSRQALAGFSSGVINLYKDGTRFATVSDRPSNRFAIPFIDSQPQCFTLNTTRAYRAGYAGAPPSCNPQIPYTADGWSSSRNGAAGELVCGHSWNGGPATGGDDPDRICVNPGDDLTVDVPLVPVPRATVTGRVVNNIDGKGIVGATVYANWPASAGAIRWGSVLSGENGYFTFSVPAVQDLFADGAAAQNYLQLWAQWTGPLLDCCGTVTQETRRSVTIYVGPLREGNSVDSGNLVVPIEQRERTCGNAQGHVRDDRNHVPVATAVVQISAVTQTNVNGDYLFACPAASGTAFRLPQGSYEFSAQRSGYYDYRSRGNRWYARVSDATILANQAITYNARLWPKGYGTITGTVRDRGTGNPVAGAALRVSLYDGTSATVSTNSSGQYRFNSVLETWPPAVLPAADAYYQHGAASHSLSVTHPSGLYLPYSQGVAALNSGETLVIDIELSIQGNM